MEIPLRYGEGNLRLRIPDRNVGGVYRPRPPDRPLKDPLPALSNTAQAGKLQDEVRGRDVLFLVSDATRDEPHGDILAAGLAALATARRVTVGVATGSHRADTPGNRAIADAATRAALAAGAPVPHVFVHDGATDPLVDLGETTRGTPIRVSEATRSFDVLLVASDVKHHYFAGYSNPVKFLLPGLAHRDSIECNHRLALEPGSRFGHHPWHPDPARRTNPVAEDMLEAWDRVLDGRPAWALTTISAGGHPVIAELGPAAKVTGETMRRFDDLATHHVAPGTRVVVSAGGAPMDSSLYLSQRALELTKAAVADGGEILLLAECRDGIADGEAAREHFWRELTRPLPEVIERITHGYRLYQHKAFRFAELLLRLAAVRVTSVLPDEDLRAIHLEPAPDAQAVLDDWIARDPDVGITFFDEANRTGVLPT